MINQALNHKNITVLHSNDNWLPLTENWLYNQIRNLPDEIENHIICQTTRNLDQFSLPNIHSCSELLPRLTNLYQRLGKLRGSSYLYQFAFSQLLVKIAEKYKADILHSHFGNTAWYNIKAAKQANLKHIATFYGYDVNFMPKQYPKWLQRYQTLFKHIDCILCEGSHMAQCIAELGCPQHKIQVHHLGIAIEEIPFKPRSWNPSEALHVLIAASFREKKGIPYAIEALGQLQHELPLKLTIIGDASPDHRSQAEKQTILTAIEKYNLQSKVRMLGYQPHAVLLEEAYKHHVFISPSVTSNDGDTEGGAPVAIIEMIGTGMPVVSTKHCDIPEVTKNSVRSLLAPERDVDGLLSHLKWLINNPDQWSKMLEAGRGYVEQEYDAGQQGVRLANIYQSISS
ncbi:glycosyltransferase [Moorena sp. SIO3H5]|uniref:glycosyltransferase n=1 Tax=Moorena sp. SIO3H5 TaxID=2607834 RepID=UPI0013BCF5C2|nr:glycosyltransferase [Moorena sp. SIO3H5]NEO68924.1 colanic acid biosynthesis glycosyltransferase WcaL [Moorena sp. SIO3H5]